MIEQQQKVYDKAFELFNRDTKTEKISRSTFDGLIALGVFTKKGLLQYVVITTYYDMRKHSDISVRSAIIDLSIEWNVTDHFIKNLIY